MHISLASMSVPGADIDFSFMANTNGSCFIVLSVRDTFNKRRDPVVVLLDDDQRIQELIDAADRARERTHEIMGRLKFQRSSPLKEGTAGLFCTACGASMAAHYTFCIACGQRVAPPQLPG